MPDTKEPLEFRTKFDGKLYANGEPFFLKGVNWWGTETDTRIPGVTDCSSEDVSGAEGGEPAARERGGPAARGPRIPGVTDFSSDDASVFLICILRYTPVEIVYPLPQREQETRC